MAGSARRAWRRLVRGDDRPRRPRRRSFFTRSAETSSTIFLILRRMRAPLIVLITIFAVSVLGLTLIPGQDAAGQPTRMGFFDAFYFMSYTATTIGYGEIPHAVHRRAAAVGDGNDLPDRHRVGVRHRVAPHAPAGPCVPSGPRAAALHPYGGPAPGALPADRRVRADRTAARPLAGRSRSPLRRARRLPGARRRARRRFVPRRRTRAGRRRRQSRTPSASPGSSTRSARGCWRSPTTTRSTSSSP